MPVPVSRLLNTTRCAAMVACAVLTGCSSSGAAPAETGQTHPATTTTAAAAADHIANFVSSVQEFAVLVAVLGVIVVLTVVPCLVLGCMAGWGVELTRARRRTSEKTRRRVKVMGPVRGCCVAYTSTTGHAFEFELKELSPGRWNVFVPAHPEIAASARIKHNRLRLIPGRDKRTRAVVSGIAIRDQVRVSERWDSVCWSQRIADPLDAYRVAVLWAESVSGARTAGRFAPPTEQHSLDPPPGSGIETLAAPYRSRCDQPHDAEFEHTTRTGHSFRFGLRNNTTGWAIHILAQPGYGHRSTNLRDTHRLRTARGELLVCWTGTLVSAVNAYRVAMLWAEATCVYITTGQSFDAAIPDAVAVSEERPAPRWIHDL